jgi:serine/threonine-protein kinase
VTTEGKPKVDLPEPPPEEYPRAFGSYVLLAPLARGGMGEVFLGKHGSVAGLEKHCVVKTLRPHLTDDREYTTRFIDEARIVVQLGHRNICHVFDVGTVGERYYLAMEYIAGKDLRTLAHDVGEQGGVMNPGLALHVVCEVLEALDYAHRHVDAATGKPLLLVHRDVSPQNVMISWEGEVKLIDFGLAASTLKMEQTSPNVVMGKLAYMSPEQVRGERVDGRADLFAAAVVLYEILVGERFYEGRSPYEIWGIAAQGGFRPRGWEAIDADLRPILDKALAGDPAQRFSTCIEFREALQQYRFGKGLHGDGPLLRSLMHQIYAGAIEESRRQLATLTQAKLKDPLAARASGVFTVTTEPTISLARSPSSSVPPRPQPTIPPREPTGPTAVAKAMFAPKRRTPVVAASVAAILLLVAAAVVASRLDGVARPDVPGPAVAKPDALKPEVPTVEEPGVEEPRVEEPKVVDAGSPSSAGEETKPQVTGGTPAPLPPSSQKKPKVEKVEKIEKIEKIEKVEEGPPVDAPPVEKPFVLPRDASIGEIIDAVVTRCADAACVKTAKLHAGDWGAFSKQTDAFRAWTEDLGRCVTVCKLR